MRSSAKTAGTAAESFSVAKSLSAVSEHLAARFFSAKQVQAVGYAQHGITVNAIVFGVAALHGIDGSAVIALVVQNVIELK